MLCKWGILPKVSLFCEKILRKHDSDETIENGFWNRKMWRVYCYHSRHRWFIRGNIPKIASRQFWMALGGPHSNKELADVTPNQWMDDDYCYILSQSHKETLTFNGIKCCFVVFIFYMLFPYILFVFSYLHTIMGNKIFVFTWVYISRTVWMHVVQMCVCVYIYI